MGAGIVAAAQWKEIWIWFGSTVGLCLGCWVLYRKDFLSKKDLPVGIFFVLCFWLGYGNWLYHLERYDEQVNWGDQLQGEYQVTIISAGQRSGTPAKKKVRYLIRLENIHYANGRRTELAGKAYLYLPEKQGHFVYGDRLRIAATLHRFQYYRNPGQVDFLNRHRGAHILGNLTPLRQAQAQYFGVNSGEKFSRGVDSLRAHIQALFLRGLPTDQAHLLNSLLFGDKSEGLDKRVMEEFAATGIIHILSVSGAHVALLMTLCTWVLRRLGLGEWKVFVLAVIVVGLYATLARWVPSVTRAFIMGVLAAAALLWQRENNALYALGIAALLMLLWNPFVIYDISFQLSTGATLGILLFGKSFQKILVSVCRIPQLLAGVAALCMSAQIMLVPFLLYYFRAIPIYSFWGNLLVIPILECVIPAGLLAIVISFFWTIPALGILKIVSILLTLAIHLNRIIAQLPGALWKIPAWEMPEIFLYYISVLVLTFILAKKEIPRIKTISVLLLLWLSLTLWQVARQPEWRVYIPDGGKSSVILVERQGKYLLYYKVGDYYSMTEERAMQSVAEYIGAEHPEMILLGKKMENLPEWWEDSRILPLYRKGHATPARRMKWRDLDITWQNGNVSIAKYPHVLYIGAERKRHEDYPWVSMYWNHYPSYYEKILRNCLRLHPQHMVFGENGAGFAPSRITEAQSLAEVENISVHRPHQDGMIVLEPRGKGWERSWKW